MEQKSNGALISSVIIVVLLIAGGVFLLKSGAKNKVSNQPNTGGTSQVTGTTTDVSDLEQGLNNINVNNLDQGL